MKQNKKRIIFWGIVFIICIILSITGNKMYYKGYGTVGKIRLKLEPIVTEFNKNIYMTNTNELTAYNKGNKILIKNKNNKKIEYTYVNENGIEYITATYSSNNSLIGDVSARGIINSIYRVNKGTADITKTINFDKLTYYSISDGIFYKPGTDKTISININSHFDEIISNAINSSYNYISDVDLANFSYEINENHYFEISKNNNLLIVSSDDNKYEICAKFTDDSDLEKSIYTIVNAIDSSLYFEISQTDILQDLTLGNVNIIKSGICGISNKFSSNVYRFIINKK